MKNKLHKKVLVAACDVYRPAAIEQLATLCKTVGVDLVNLGTGISPVEISKKAKEKAFNEHYDILLIDTAGRLQIDTTLMNELNDVKDAIDPDEILLLVDAMAGQDAVNVANEFNQQLTLTGAIMSKLDGDSRGGAALSIRHMTGVPIKLTGVGEKLTDLDIFHPSLKQLIKAVAVEVARYVPHKKRQRVFDESIRHNLIESKEYYRTYKELKNSPPQYDVYLTGSDQVFNGLISPQALPARLLSFVNKGVRISYAASAGEKSFQETIEKEVVDALREFTAISVREEALKEYIQSKWKLEVEQHIDPVFLLEKNQKYN